MLLCIKQASTKVGLAITRSQWGKLLESGHAHRWPGDCLLQTLGVQLAAGDPSQAEENWAGLRGAQM